VIEEVVGIGRLLDLGRRLVLPRAIANCDVFIEQVPDVGGRSRVAGGGRYGEKCSEGDGRQVQDLLHGHTCE
jgi:hypothetical protein